MNARALTHGERVRIIIAAVEENGARGPDAGGNYATHCPECVHVVGYEDREWKLTFKLSGKTTKGDPVTPEHAVWACYRCGFRGRGDLSELADDVDRAPPPEPGAPDPALVAFRQDVTEAAANSIALSPAVLEDPRVRPTASYLRGRGVLEQAIAAGALACFAGKYRGRVVFPIRPGPRQPWQGFSARAVWDCTKADRYRTPRAWDRVNAVWGPEFLDRAPPGPLLVVEGIFGALGRFPCAWATLGKDVAAGQLDAVARARRPVVVAMDGDAWQVGRAISAQLALRGVSASWARLPPGTQPDTPGIDPFDFVMSGQ